MTPNINDKNETPEMIKRREAGKAGHLWCIEILCKIGASTRKWVRVNLYYQELLKIREDIFIYGVMLPDDPRSFTVVPPWELLNITARKQGTWLDFDPSYG